MARRHAGRARGAAPSRMTLAIAAQAARLSVEDGLGWRDACQRAAHALNAPPHTPMPSRALMDEQLRAHMALFCPEQGAELAALRALALRWMQRLAAFRPHITGAVWSGLATRHAEIWLHTFCDDPKALEIFLVNEGERYTLHSAGDVDGAPAHWLDMESWCTELGKRVGVHVLVRARAALGGALGRDADAEAALGNERQLRERMACAQTATKGQEWGTFTPFPLEP
ncbi:MAG: hypothetical protein IJM64_02945 [Ottowia sp.]|nr:hypothetical protein [Ottowia sp.]